MTGATNLKPGSTVAYGEVGAEYVDGHTGERMVMKPKDMRGIKSEGMVLSEKELGLGEDHDGILLLDDKLPVGAPLSETLGETVLLLELQPNRPDCLGIVGIAREVSALLRQTLREPGGDPLGNDRAEGPRRPHRGRRRVSQVRGGSPRERPHRPVARVDAAASDRRRACGRSRTSSTSPTT